MSYSNSFSESAQQPTLNYPIRDQKLTSSGHNQYFLTLFMPGEVGGRKVPTYGIESTTSKKILLTQDIVVPSSANGSSPEFLVLSFPHNVKCQGKIFLKWAQEGINQWCYFTNITYSELLNSGYSKARSVSSIITVSASTIATGFAPLQGNLDAITYSYLWNLRDPTITSILPQCVDEKNLVANGQLSDGAVGLGLPLYEPVLSPTSPLTFETTYQDDIILPTVTLTNLNGAANPVIVQLPTMVFGSFRIEYTATWTLTAAPVGRAGIRFGYGSRIFNPVNNTESEIEEAGGATQSITGGQLLQTTCWSNTKGRNGLSAPITYLSFYWNGVAGNNGVGTCQIDVNLFILEDLTPGYLSPGTAFHVRNPVPNSIILLGGGINFEAVPNSTLARDLKTTSGNSVIDISDLKMVKKALSRHERDPNLKMCYSRLQYMDLCAKGYFTQMSHRAVLHEYVNQAGGWSTLGDIVGAGLGFTPFRAFAPLAPIVGRLLDGHQREQETPQQKKHYASGRRNLCAGEETLTFKAQPYWIDWSEKSNQSRVTRMLSFIKSIGWGEAMMRESKMKTVDVADGYYPIMALEIQRYWEKARLLNQPIARATPAGMIGCGMGKSLGELLQIHGHLEDCVIENGYVRPLKPMQWSIVAALWYSPRSEWIMMEEAGETPEGVELLSCCCAALCDSQHVILIDKDGRHTGTKSSEPFFSMENKEGAKWAVSCEHNTALYATKAMLQRSQTATPQEGGRRNLCGTVVAQQDGSAFSATVGEGEEYDDTIPRSTWSKYVYRPDDPEAVNKSFNYLRGLATEYVDEMNVATGVTISNLAGAKGKAVSVVVSLRPLQGFSYRKMLLSFSGQEPITAFIRKENISGFPEGQQEADQAEEMELLFSLYTALFLSQLSDQFFITLLCEQDHLADSCSFGGNSLGLAFLMALLNVPRGPMITGGLKMDGSTIGVKYIQQKFASFLNAYPIIYASGSDSTLQGRIETGDIAAGAYNQATRYTGSLALSDTKNIFEVSNFSSAVLAALGAALTMRKVGVEKISTPTEEQQKRRVQTEKAYAGIRTTPMVMNPNVPQVQKTATRPSLFNSLIPVASPTGKGQKYTFSELKQEYPDIMKDYTQEPAPEKKGNVIGEISSRIYKAKYPTKKKPPLGVKAREVVIKMYNFLSDSDFAKGHSKGATQVRNLLQEVSPSMESYPTLDGDAASRVATKVRSAWDLWTQTPKQDQTTRDRLSITKFGGGGQQKIVTANRKNIPERISTQSRTIAPGYPQTKEPPQQEEMAADYYEEEYEDEGDGEDIDYEA